MLDNEFRDLVANGQIKWVVGDVTKFNGQSVEITESDGKNSPATAAAGASGSTTIDANVVIYGTGFGKDYSIFDDATQQQLSPEPDGLYLFRHTVDCPCCY